MPLDYLPILIMLIVAAGMAAAALVLPHFLGPRIRNQAKQETIESGKINYGDARRRIPVQYYMVAMLFILFDLELLFLYPWAVRFWDLEWFGLIQAGIFVFLLIESFVYVWKKGVLEWK